MKTKLQLILLAMLMGVTLMATAAEPTLDQVYTATRSGHLVEARAMMQEVLQAHPNSGKAHYVNAEVLAKSGDLTTARTELALAEKLEPGLPSINPRSVQELQQALNGRSGTMAKPAPGAPTISWSTILLIGGLALLLVVWLVRRQARQYPVAAPGQQPGGYYPPGPMPMGQPMQPGGGGMGLMGSLATGAALGAGLVAGEALAHNLMGGSSNSGGNMPQGGDVNGDLGGQDFGVSDSGSWDSGGGGGGDWT